MEHDVVSLTKALVEIPSVTRNSNAPIADFLQSLLANAGWEVERTEYIDPNGELKVNLVAKLGEGNGGLAFCSHNDTVPGQEQDWPAFTPEIRDGMLYGRGSCDMKGPLAATIVACLNIDPQTLKKPLYLVLTADEEIGLIGAKKLVEASEILQRDRPEFGVVAEPTELIPVYSHKGYAMITAKATGRAAHVAMGTGESALFKVVPFMADLVALDEELRTNPDYQDDIYEPTHHTLNFVVDTGQAATNVTAPFATVTIGIRPMRSAKSEEVYDRILALAANYDVTVESDYMPPLFAPIDCALVQAATALTGKSPETVSYGTDGAYLGACIEQLVILGPGSINVAHTVGEHIAVDDLHAAVTLYEQLIAALCV